MSKLYANPVRVYLLLGAIALFGIFSALNLPISLFPNSSKPMVWVGIPYGNLTADEFLNTYGAIFENQLQNISGKNVEVDYIEASYRSKRVSYVIWFKWGTDPDDARRETEIVVSSFSARLPEESRDGVNTWLNNENTGFFALSFYSETRDMNSLYQILEPILSPKIASVKDADNPILWNPSRREIRIELIPEVMATLQLFPHDVEKAIDAVLSGRAGGSVSMGPNTLQIQIPRQIEKVEDLGTISIPTASGRLVHLSDIARINLRPNSLHNRSFKTSGAPSLILFATPKPGGNVKKMSEDLLHVVNEAMPSFPPDVKYRKLVDPSEFIRSAIKNVFFEVGLATFLAVLVLFVFIGSFKNVVTAAIEIPMSMILAFILMRFFDMNLNLVSLGGLALSAGMNVDASVVIIDNIFRHFDMHPGSHDFKSRLRIITEAVKEVRFAIIAATISSLVVFLPLAFTSDLTYAILGDLAKAVVFSHGFSVFVAIILVPTIRLQLLSREKEKLPKSLIESPLKKFEDWYSKALSYFIRQPKLKWGIYGGLAASLVILLLFVLPRLPKEVIGKPDTDWMVLSVSTDGNTLLKQMEVQSEAVERDLLDHFGDKINYTFNQIRRPNQATIMARLKNKKDMQQVWKSMEKHFTNTPFTRYWVGPWNPSELPIPDPPHMEIAVRGKKAKDTALITREIIDLLESNKAFHRIWADPNVSVEKGIFLKPHYEQWEALAKQGVLFSPSDLADLLRVATSGRIAGYFPVEDRMTEMVMKYPPNTVENIETVEAFPLGVGSKLVPLKALATVRVKEAEPTIYRENQKELFEILGKQRHGEEATKDAALIKAKKLVEQWKKSAQGIEARQLGVSVNFEDPAKEVTEARDQLVMAIGLSVLLILITLMMQFGSFWEPLVILVSVPLGFIGVLGSLYIFGSTLSLNSILGVILLNGIAVANSIILVDFIKRLVAKGKEPLEAAIEATRKRLRPILITSLTTILGMMPIAFGMGEGGHILQPLGITVSGGLWVSTLLTLFIVPALYVTNLEWRRSDHALAKRWLKPLGSLIGTFIRPLHPATLKRIKPQKGHSS